MEHTFDTPGPVELYVELGKGSLAVTAADVAVTTVVVRGPQPEEVAVEQERDRIRVLAPRHRMGFLGGAEPAHVVEVTLPTGSRLVSRTGSADQTAHGELGEARVKSGSGDVDLDHVSGHAVVDTGSGDVRLRHVGGELRVKSGSGDVAVERAEGNAGVSTGSGDVWIGTTGASAVLKSGSGDLRVDRAGADLSLSTASGDVAVELQERDGVTARNVSGDVRIGVPTGVPVWTDVSTVTGRLASSLEGAGQPGPGEQHLEVRARSVSGDIILEQR